ncbi:effector-associated constant component EACC1 [Glycomyces harbinensis]|uniref:Uncharacterized protein n=1 Tax=Glycomyces harbinensis TaxID=58114 RepID=A0A1G7BXE3_9ACTN|nr:hypothetical protein [Glycomyces harbinensis]SDE31791.1 hypothetical protein SAMN05216270_11833 [Glycomyces harbinensis]
MEAVIAVVGAGGNRDDLAALRQWLVREDAFRGRVAFAPAEVREGELGAVQELLTVALTAGSFNALCQAIAAWFQARRSELEVEVTNSEGGSVRISAKGAVVKSVAKKLDLGR